MSDYESPFKQPGHEGEHYAMHGGHMHINGPRDVDLAAWLNKSAYHPARTPVQQLAHSIARQIVANLGALMHPLVPAGDDKTTAYRLLGDVLMYLNRALAVGGGPPISEEEVPEVEAALRGMLASLEGEAAALEALLQRDRRYEHAQLSEPAPREAPGFLGVAGEAPAEEGTVPDRADRAYAAGVPHTLEIPDSSGAARVAVSSAPGAVTLHLVGAGSAAAFLEPDHLSRLLETLAGAGSNAFNG